MKVNYLLGLPTFLMVVGLAWASQSHAVQWDTSYSYNELDDELPEVESLLSQEDSASSSFDLKPTQKPTTLQEQNFELVKQFDSIQHEVQELRGLVETQQNELKILKNQLATAKATPAAPSTNSADSLKSNSGLELNASGITYKPAGN